MAKPRKSRVNSVATETKAKPQMNTSHLMAASSATRIARAADSGFDPQALLAKPLDDIKPPVPMPLGSFVGIATKREFDKAKNEKQSPLVRFTVVAQEALPDVDPDELSRSTDPTQGGKPLSENEQRLEFWLTPDAVYRLKEFGEDHCKIDPTEASNLAELIELIPGRPFVFTITESPNKKNPERPYRNITSTAAVPET